MASAGSDAQLESARFQRAAADVDQHHGAVLPDEPALPPPERAEAHLVHGNGDGRPLRLENQIGAVHREQLGARVSKKGAGAVVDVFDPAEASDDESAHHHSATVRAMMRQASGTAPCSSALRRAIEPGRP